MAEFIDICIDYEAQDFIFYDDNGKHVPVGMILDRGDPSANTDTIRIQHDEIEKL